MTNTKHTARQNASERMVTCEATTGGGVHYRVGIWRVRTTALNVIFEVVEPPQGTGKSFLYKQIERLVCRKDNKCPHGLLDWADGTYTVYPNRNGTPYYFEPVTTPDVGGVAA